MPLYNPNTTELFGCTVCWIKCRWILLHHFVVVYHHRDGNKDEKTLIEIDFVTKILF
jgi:hypothetical protein